MKQKNRKLVFRAITSIPFTWAEQIRLACRGDAQIRLYTKRLRGDWRTPVTVTITWKEDV